MGALTVAAASLAGVLLIALWMVSVVGWVRTAPLRRGRLPPQVEPANRVPPGPRRTSRATYLPGAIGSLLFVAGVAGAIQGLGAGAIGLAVVASAIAGAGFSARVSQIEAGPDGLMVAYGGRRSFHVGWDDLRSLAPPRWPLGGWRVAREGEHRVLMASDLLGHEDLLDCALRRAGLRYRGRSWIRPST